MKTKKATIRARRTVICIALTILTIISILYENGIIGTAHHKPKTQEESSNVAVSVTSENTIEHWNDSEVNIVKPVVERNAYAMPATLFGSSSGSGVGDLVFEEPSVEENRYSTFLEGSAPQLTVKCSDETLIAEFQQFLSDYQVGNVNTSILERYGDENEYLLACIIDCEAGGTHDLNELLLVGWTVLCRRNSNCRDFRDVNTINEVLSQRNQYPETYRKIQNGHGATEQCLLAAHILLTTPYLLAQDQNGSWYILGTDMLFQTGFHPTWNVYEILQTRYHVYSGE